MQMSFFSLMTAVLWGSLLTGVLWLLRKKIVGLFTVYMVALVYLFSLLRMLLPLELPLTQTIPMPEIMNAVTAVVYNQLWSNASTVFRPLHLLAAVWGAGVLIGFVFSALRNLRYKRQLLQSVQDPPDPVYKLMERVRQDTGKNRSVQIKVGSALDTPVGFGLIKKYIVLPEMDYDDETLYWVLRHEYTHFLNHDFTVTMLSSAFRLVFWWNPAAYLLRRDLEQVLEMKCDITVAAKLSKWEAADYMDVILYHTKVIGEKPRRKPRLPKHGLGLLGRRKDSSVKERIKYIKQVKERGERPAWHQALFAALAALMFVGSYFFVIQSEFEAPMEEILTEPGMYGVSEDEIYIRMNEDGEYEFVDPYGVFVISQEAAEEYIEEGYRYEEGSL